MSRRLMALQSVVAQALLIAATLAEPAAAEWGRPLGAGYDGPEVRPRPVTPAPPDLSPDERSTMAVFERATKSVVFISNTAIQRDFWSFDVLEVPQGSGSGFVWNKQGHIVTNFHVIYGANAIKVTLADRSEHQAKLVGADPDHRSGKSDEGSVAMRWTRRRVEARSRSAAGKARRRAAQ